MSKPRKISERAKKFADLMLTGTLSATRAYRQAGFTAIGHAAEANASRMLRNADVMQYMESERAKLRSKGEIERDEIVGFLAKVLRTPVGELTPDSVLAQEYLDEVTEDASRRRVKMVSKMDAVKQICSMMGWNAPAVVEVNADNAMLGLLNRIRART